MILPIDDGKPQAGPDYRVVVVTMEMSLNEGSMRMGLTMRATDRGLDAATSNAASQRSRLMVTLSSDTFSPDHL